MSFVLHSSDFFLPLNELEVDLDYIANSTMSLCDECDTEVLSDQLIECNSCTRHLCPECFFSEFDTICYDCATQQSGE